MSYINIGFPIGRKSRYFFWIKANTSVGYSLLNVVNDIMEILLKLQDFMVLEEQTEFMVLTEFLFQKFIVGLEAEYIFGKTENNILSKD